MNTALVILIFGLSFTVILGVVIYLTNPRRAANQQFLLFSLAAGAWLGSVLAVFLSSVPASAEFWIRCASIAGAFVPVSFVLLKHSIRDPALSFAQRLRLTLPWFYAYGLIALYCMTPLYLRGAEIPETGVPNAVQGSLAILYPIYIAGTMFVVIRKFIGEMRQARGMPLFEMRFVFAGLLTFIGAGVCGAVLPLMTRSSQVVGLAPLWVVIMNSVIAYGIATKRIMDVGAAVRRLISYALLFAYLASVYSIVWWSVGSILEFFSIQAPFVPPLLAALAIVLTMSSAQSVLTVFVNRLFINLHELNLQEALLNADSVFSTVTTTDDLLSRFKALLTKATGTDIISIYSCTDIGVGADIQRVPRSMTGERSLVRHLAKTRRPFLSSDSYRHPDAEELHEAVAQLTSLQGVLALGVHARDQLQAIVVIGDKLSGRPYEADEQQSLQILVNRLAIALENAKLYSSIQESKLYMELLLDQLVSGVIAANDEGQIAVCNKEACKILRMQPEDLVGACIEQFPAPIAQAMRATLDQQQSQRDQHAILHLANGITVPIRFGAGPFSDGNFHGILLVFEDLTELKKLEAQLRQADRLSTLGTLSASLAHEIRNPLVPIKTFVELIPERINDHAFLEQFAQIVGGEVARIENIINQLLSFSRTGNSERAPADVHEILESTVALLHHDLTRRGVQLAMECCDKLELVNADRQQLGQVFINIIRNSCEAMPDGGRLLIRTTQDPVGSNGEVRHMEILVSDDGAGIGEEELAHIFDPFFTTKITGTGLGLSIVYGIIADHGGTINVMSKPERGTSIQIKLPIIRSIHS